MRILNTFAILFATLCFAFVSCSKNEPDTPDNPDQNNKKYVLLTAEGIADGAGYYAVYNELPTGDVKNTAGYSLQASSYGGFRTYKNWIFNRSNLLGESGVLKFSVGKDGRLKEDGFIKCDGSAQSVVVNETLGFYFDPGRGKKRIQKFNPSTMQRTGEIDLSSVVDEKISPNVYTGNQTLAVKEGKLFVNITYSPEGSSGHNDNIRHYALAVIDIASEKIEKTIVLDFLDVYNQGHSPSEYPAWLLGEDGHLYFLSTGWDQVNGAYNFHPSCIFRIKKGETDFDKNWHVYPKDLNSRLSIGVMWSMGFYKGKLYVEASDENITNFGDFGKVDGYHVYSLDIENKAVAKIESVPTTVFGHSAGTFYRTSDKLFVRVVNETIGYNGLYVINEDGRTASPAFNVIQGGQPMGFAELHD